MDKALGIDSPGVPTIIIGNVALVGEDQIRDRLDAAIRQELASPTRNATANGTVTANCPGTVSSLTVPLVIVCAGIASINPCGLAVLIILLLSIIALQTRRQVLMVGITFIAAVFLFYFIAGLGFLSFINNSATGISSLIATAAAAIAIVLGLVNIVDAAVRKEGFLLAIPVSKKPVLERYIRTATLPAAFVLGVLVGIFELPCAGGLYLTILGLVSSTTTLAEGIPYLLLFNLIFILPLIVVLLVVVFGLPPERVNTWRLENRRMLRFAIGLAMVAVGLVILLVPSFH
ncbi:cytochrome c biogenesis CcdA family protein [Methanoregula sp.]|uniref:cytochrome c biogenesis CcdA family protein n=1 Tax=Methanoregula sp. TaxID=2052170 RepID=UPI00356582A7